MSSQPPQSQLLSQSWFDSAWIPQLNRHNVLDYFSQRSNPFYDRTCNNEIIRMQRSDPAQLLNMTGTEYMLLHVQEPVLYLIRKVNRLSPEKVTPLANFYILMGVVYQCPDLESIVNSRLLAALSLLNEAFIEANSFARYDPSKGYYWEFPNDNSTGKQQQRRSVVEEEPHEHQRKKVDILLNELIKKFPPKAFAGKESGQPAIVNDKTEATKSDSKEGEGERGGGGGGEGGQPSATGSGLKRTSQQAGADKIPDAKRKRT